MIYLDTSLLVTALTAEPDTARVQAWLVKFEAGALCISDWAVSEFSSALALKLRRGELNADERARVLSNWRVTQRDNLVVIPVPQPAYDLAARFCDRHELGLRAGDALHLAVASLGGHSLATLDARMAKGAVAVGVQVEGVRR